MSAPPRKPVPQPLAASLPPRRDTIAIHYVRAALHGARRHGLDTNQLLQRVGIEPILLDQPRARVTPDQYTRLIQGLWLLTADEHLGFGRQPRVLGTFATMCQLVIHTKTLGQALERAAQFYRLFGIDWSMLLHRERHECRVEVVIPVELDPEHFITESMMMIWHGLASWLVKRRIPLSRVQFAYPEPPQVAEYEAIFFAPAMVFNAPHTELTFPADYLELPIQQDEDTLEVFLRTAPARLLVKFKNTHSLTSRIRELLKPHLGSELPAFDEVAASFCLSPQTLRRRLAAEDKSFQVIKDELRRDAAINLLAQSDLTLEDVSLQLGFSEPSTFYRAFKKWTGVTPGLYRQIQRQ